MRLRNHEGLHQTEHHPTNHTELQWDCKTTKDCNSIDRVASELHGLHAATACLGEGSTAMQPSSGHRKYKDGNPDRNLHNRIELR